MRLHDGFDWFSFVFILGAMAFVGYLIFILIR